MISRIDPDRELYEAGLRARRDRAAIQQASEEKGWARGHAKGREEGREQGREETRRADIQSLQTALGQDVTPMEDLQTRSWQELESVWARLQAEMLATLTDRK